MAAPYARSAEQGVRRRRSARGAVCAAVTLLAGVLAGCGGSDPLMVPEPTTTATTKTGAAATPLVTVPGTLAWEFINDLQPTLKGEVALALLPVGGDRALTLGDWRSGPAWSTMKVPLSLAALRANAGLASSANAAITYSDNAAADTLWQALGSGATAAADVEEVLREGGDSVTEVPATRTRKDYSAFGQADWSVDDQLTFAARLPCLPEADAVTSLMGKISSGQRWGLGTLTGAEFKGGWGPDTGGSYLVRQFGLIPVDGGLLAVVIAAQPDSGSFDEGTTMLTKISTLVGKHLDELRGGRCAGGS
ncbi:hypothetical protein ACWIGI_17230 [Nocardia sp. NPDC055321]